MSERVMSSGNIPLVTQKREGGRRRKERRKKGVICNVSTGHREAVRFVEKRGQSRSADQEAGEEERESGKREQGGMRRGNGSRRKRKGRKKESGQRELRRGSTGESVEEEEA